jgi:arylsulfatase A-like enzyme
MKHPRHSLLLSLFALAAACFFLPTSLSAAEKPNVVLIYIDDLGYGDLGCYDCKDIPTPHVDRLADEGVRFTASYIVNPPCCPSRCSLIMGQYGQRFGKYGMSRGLPIPADRPTLAKFMGKNGYVTGQIGKWDIGTKAQGPLHVGFAEVAQKPPKKKGAKYFCTNEAGKTQWLTDYDGDNIVEFIERHKAKPFFLYWSPEAVHSRNDEAPPSLTKRTTAKGKRSKLAGAIVSVDDQVGKLLDVLDKQGLRKNTLVIFSSDNGANGSENGSSAPYRGGKGSGTQQEGWVRVPTIFSMPGVIPQGKDYHKQIANFDFYSTIASVAGLPIPKHCDGVDLIPYVNGKKKGEPHEYLFWLNNEPGDAVRRHLIAVRWQDWRLYKQYDKDPWQLFDLKADPKEERNVAAKHPDVVNQLSVKHAAWVKTLAPLGKIPKVEKPDGRIPAGHGWTFAKGKGKAEGN